MAEFVDPYYLLSVKASPSRGAMSCSTQPLIWNLVGQLLGEGSDDWKFWWKETARPFALLLDQAGYDGEEQLRYLVFYYHCIVPTLGMGPDALGRPKSWQSFMTDHFSPVEFSWDWGHGKDRPVIRFSTEPIGPYAGTSLDPYNRLATQHALHQCHYLLPRCDLSLFNYLSKEILTYESPLHGPPPYPARTEHQSRTFIAFDLGKDGVMLKVYFLPIFKARAAKQSTWTVVKQALKGLSLMFSLDLPAIDTLQLFLACSSEGKKLDTEIFAIDCIAPACSRFKVYMRTQSTSFQSVREIMTLGGMFANPAVSLNSLEELKELWNLVLSSGEDATVIEDAWLPQKSHPTAGILYYFDITQGQALPGVKMYIPVRHYAQSDSAVIEGLQRYFESRSRFQTVQRYSDALKSILRLSSASDVSNDGAYHRELQTYLGCSISEGRLKLTSYLSPRVYTP